MALRKIVELKVGDVVPEGATLLEKKQVRGKYIGESYVRTEGIFPFTRTIYKNLFEEDTIFVYEVPA